MHPGLAATPDMQLIYGNYFSGNGPPGNGPPGGAAPGRGRGAFPCPTGECLANPKIQTVSALPPGTSPPNTVITDHAGHQPALQTPTAASPSPTPHPPTPPQ